jgi:hypothetical protein
VVVNAVHKRCPPAAWGGSSYSAKVGAPLLLTVAADATERDVRARVVAAAHAGGAAVHALPFRVLFANDRYDEDPGCCTRTHARARAQGDKL